MQPRVLGAAVGLAVLAGVAVPCAVTGDGASGPPRAALTVTAAVLQERLRAVALGTVDDGFAATSGPGSATPLVADLAAFDADLQRLVRFGTGKTIGTIGDVGLTFTWETQQALGDTLTLTGTETDTLRPGTTTRQGDTLGFVTTFTGSTEVYRTPVTVVLRRSGSSWVVEHVRTAGGSSLTGQGGF